MSVVTPPTSKKKDVYKRQHEIFNEFKRDQVIRDAIEWLDDELAH